MRSWGGKQHEPDEPALQKQELSNKLGPHSSCSWAHELTR